MAQQVVGVPVVRVVTPTIDTAAYASGDRLGTIMTLSNVFQLSHSMFLTSIIVYDKALQSQPIDLFLFQELPTIASADNAPLDFTDAQLDRCIGAFAADGTYFTTASNSLQAKTVNLHLMARDLQFKDVFAVAKIRGAATYGSASALTFQFNFVNG